MKPNVGTDSVLLAPITAATTARTANLDCIGANYATIRVVVGAEVNTNATNVPLLLSESDDTVVTNFVTFNASYNRTLDNTAGAIATHHVDLDGRKRYLRITVTPDTTTNGAIITSASATLYKELKTATAGMYGPDVVVG